jgi:hypothetical protein
LAAVPTIRKAWTNPETETPFIYIASLISVSTSFLVMQSFTFSAYAFPVYLVACNIAILLILSRKRISSYLPSLHNAGRAG